MTTVEALPPETLEHIISFLGAPHGCRHLPYIKPSTGEDERRDLCAAALVGRSWRRPSQRVLWEEIRIFSKETLRLFVEATLATGYRTRYLFVGGHEYWVGVGGAGRLIQGCIGLRRLRIVDCKNVVAVLRLPELQGAPTVSTRSQRLRRALANSVVQESRSSTLRIIPTSSVSTTTPRWFRPSTSSSHTSASLAADAFHP